jgi:cell wall-associated NlpC family hydrolase
VIKENEEEMRKAIVAEALSWVGTPYVSNAMIKGPKGGTDCAMILIGIYAAVGLIPKEFDPRPYPPQWHVHRNEEKYLNYVLQFVKQTKNPPERKPLPGDLVMFKMNKVFAHGGVIIDWPLIIHAVGNNIVRPDDISKNTTGKRALWTVPQMFFSYWD